MIAYAEKIALFPLGFSHCRTQFLMFHRVERDYSVPNMQIFIFEFINNKNYLVVVVVAGVGGASTRGNACGRFASLQKSSWNLLMLIN